MSSRHNKTVSLGDRISLKELLKQVCGYEEVKDDQKERPAGKVRTEVVGGLAEGTSSPEEVLLQDEQ